MARSVKGGHFGGLAEGCLSDIGILYSEVLVEPVSRALIFMMHVSNTTNGLEYSRLMFADDIKFSGTANSEVIQRDLSKIY